jgi:uncharacterized OB-fold protein
MGAQVDKPVPLPDEWSRPYWEAARDHRLVVQRCTACGHAQYPPDVVCHACQADDFSYDEVSGTGTVWSFATFRRSLMPVFEAPYIITLVDLDDVDVRMLTNLVEVDPDDAAIGMAVEVTFEDRGEWSIPQFRPVREVAS